MADSEKPYATDEARKRPWLRPFLKRRSFVIVANWVFQNTLVMATSERVFRFALEFACAVTIFVTVSSFVSNFENAVLSLFTAHTINWALNGNFWATQKFFGRKYSSAKMNQFLMKLRQRARLSQDGVAAIAVFGSLSRGQFSESSDLDVRIVRKPGIFSWAKANLFALQLRLIASVRTLPLDLLVLDNINQIYEHISSNESPVVIYDPDNLLARPKVISAKKNLRQKYGI